VSQRKIKFLVNREMPGRRSYLAGQSDSFPVEECEYEVARGYAEYVAKPPEGSVALEEQETPVEEPQERSLEELTVPELKDKAREAGVEGVSGMNKGELLEALKGE
jgi:hypothetical protein